MDIYDMRTFKLFVKASFMLSYGPKDILCFEHKHVCLDCLQLILEPPTQTRCC